MENTITLPYLVELTDESKTKVCIIEDIVKIVQLEGLTPPTWDQFVHMYNQSVFDLERKQANILTFRELTKHFKNSH